MKTPVRGKSRSVRIGVCSSVSCRDPSGTMPFSRPSNGSRSSASSRIDNHPLARQTHHHVRADASVAQF